MQSDRFEEVIARQIVSEALDVEVELYDDGSKVGGRMVDAVFKYPEGSTAALEIVGDVDVPSAQQWGRLAKDGFTFQIEGLNHGWFVSIYDRVSIDNLVRGELLAILGRLEAEGISRYRGRRQRRYRFDELGELDPIEGLHDRAATGGVRAAILNEGWPPGKVMLNPAGRVGVGSLDPNDTSKWLSNFLRGARGTQKAEKLRDHVGAERHVFVWATSTTDMAVQGVLEGSIEVGPATAAPELPDGITHAWIGGMMSSQGAIAWFPDRGWWRTPWAWPPRDDL